jgi:predicted amidophosphoribosyltransferase
MIRFMKKNQSSRICACLASLLAQGLREDAPYLLEGDILVPVPADPGRLAERGFDNVVELAQDLASRVLLPPAADVLVKTRATEDMRSLARGARRSALTGSMGIVERRRHYIQDARVLLLDDVVTSGSTLDVAAEVLLAAGARSVVGVTLARSESSQDSQW